MPRSRTFVERWLPKRSLNGESNQSSTSDSDQKASNSTPEKSPRESELSKTSAGHTYTRPTKKKVYPVRYLFNSMSNCNTCIRSPHEQSRSTFRLLPIKRENLDKIVMTSSTQPEHAYPADHAVISASPPVSCSGQVKIGSIDVPVPTTKSDHDKAISTSRMTVPWPATSSSMIDLPVGKNPHEVKIVISAITDSDPKVEDCKQMSDLQDSNCEKMSKMDLDLDFDLDSYLNTGTFPKRGESKVYRKKLRERLRVFEKLGRGESISSE